MKKLIIFLLIGLFSSLIQAGEDEDDISVNGFYYSANSSFPYESAILVGPDFQEGTPILKCYIQGTLESDSSFVARLQRIIDALDNSYIPAFRATKSKKKKH